jgi:hypothetical protein
MVDHVAEIGITLAKTKRPKLPTMGRKSHKGAHRSGWPYCLNALKQLEKKDGIIFEDFVERTFVKVGPAQAWRAPWVGVFHHPQSTPQWFRDEETPPKMLKKKSFKNSIPMLRGCITLSEYVGRWLRQELKLPTLVVKHPTEFPATTFSMDKYVANSPRKMVQVGWYLRNMRAIYQLPPPLNVEKIHLFQQAPWIKKCLNRVDKKSPFRNRPQYEPVTVLSNLPNQQYDDLLGESVVFLELFDSSANNAVIESIARCTPLCVNRHPAVVEYLGADYPLFYDDIQQVPTMITDENVAAAHTYLKEMDRTELTIAHFVQSIQDFLNLLGPEL